ncbi:MAG: bifunctional nuclease family protein, partial [Myxococcales bacterium]|nr:bifunctional nuclease family protein [Myxococcales bacterium]
MRTTHVATISFLCLSVWACAGSLETVDTRPIDPVLISPSMAASLDHDGFVPMQVFDLMETESGPVVVLADPDIGTILPIWIGNAEALTIALRLHGEVFDRPLTHDLFDALVRETGAVVAEVRLDSLVGEAFAASVLLESDGRLIWLDSRAWDSIAMGLSPQVPTYA